MTRQTFQIPKLVAILAVAVLSVTACGGDDGTTEAGQASQHQPEGPTLPEETAGATPVTDADVPDTGSVDR